MTKKIVFKTDDELFEEQLAPKRKLYEIEALESLRKLLPAKFLAVSDDDLLDAWEDFSEKTYCAGFLCVDQEKADHFVELTKVVDK